MKNIKCVETGCVFPSFKDAALYANLFDGSGISKCCNGKAKTAGGFHWCFTDESVASRTAAPDPTPVASSNNPVDIEAVIKDAVNNAADRIISEMKRYVDSRIEDVENKIEELENSRSSEDEEKARKARARSDFKYRFKSFMRRWRKRIALDTVEGGMLGAAAFLLTLIPGVAKFSILTSTGIGLGVGFVFAVAMCIGAGIKNGIRA